MGDVREKIRGTKISIHEAVEEIKRRSK
jgi:hypothetical protein